MRLLATRTGRLDQPPADDARDLDPRDRLLRPVQRAEHRLSLAIKIGARCPTPVSTANNLSVRAGEVSPPAARRLQNKHLILET
jgi:hypothetical protein